MITEAGLGCKRRPQRNEHRIRPSAMSNTRARGRAAARRRLSTPVSPFPGRGPGCGRRPATSGSCPVAERRRARRACRRPLPMPRTGQRATTSTSGPYATSAAEGARRKRQLAMAGTLKQGMATLEIEADPRRLQPMISFRSAIGLRLWSMQWELPGSKANDRPAPGSKPEIDVTPIMIEAGLAVFEETPLGKELVDFATDRVVVHIYRSMCREAIAHSSIKRIFQCHALLFLFALPLDAILQY